jgi:type 1 glutamine amidotransferase
MNIKKLFLLTFSLIFLLATSLSQTSYNVLHYTETSGFDHQTRNNSLSMFNSYPMLNVTLDNNGSEFDSLSTLLSYDLIIFSNTSGDQLLDSAQRNHFEQYIQNGGNLLGIHTATDTYRHSSANGSSKGSWDFYPETLGGSLQQNPNHVSGTPAYEIYKIGQHPTTDSLPDPWLKNEEYYYWENGYLDTNIQVILKVEETVGPNSQVNSYDSSRAVSWYKEQNNGSRIFYTSMGHANSNFTSDTLFQSHLLAATYWCLGILTSLDENASQENISFNVYPNPTKNSININAEEQTKLNSIQLRDLSGKLLHQQFNQRLPYTINTSKYPSGVYFLILETDNNLIEKKVVKWK